MTSFLVSACSVACIHFRAALAGLLKLLGKPMKPRTWNTWILLPTYGFISGWGHRWSGRKRNFCASQLFTHWPIQGSGISEGSITYVTYARKLLHACNRPHKTHCKQKEVQFFCIENMCAKKHAQRSKTKTCENGSNKTSENESIGCCQVKTSLKMPQMRWKSQAEQLRRGAVAWRLRSVPKSLRRSCAPLDAIAKVWCEKTKLYFHITYHYWTLLSYQFLIQDCVKAITKTSTPQAVNQPFKKKTEA